MGAFTYCSSLTQISFPSTLTFIDRDAFEECKALTRVDYASVEQLCTIKYKSDDPLQGIDLLINPLYYAKHIYIGGEEMTDIVIPSSVSAINACAFINCSSLKSVYIPSSVKSIGYGAFYGCTGLTGLNIPNTVEQVGKLAIDNSLKESLPLEGEIRYAGSCAYSVEDKTKNTYTLRSGTKGMTPGLFADCDNLTFFEIPVGITSVEEEIFLNCHNLKSVTIPEGVTILKCRSFENCGLTSVVLPRSLEEFDFRTAPFAFCNSLRYVEINSDIYSEGDYLFYGPVEELKIIGDATSVTFKFSTLKKLSLGEKVNKISSNAFYECTGLTEVVCNSLIPPVCQTQAFGDVRDCTLYVPAEAMNAYLSDTFWSSFKEIKRIEKPSINLMDVSTFRGYGIELDMDLITYTRTFSNTSWQALYVPFTMEYSEWEADFDIARINDIHQFDDDDNGTIDRTELEVIKVTSGSIEANTPYLIRAKEAGEKTFTLANRTLYKAEEKSYTVSSWNTLFTFTGTYSGVAGSDMVSNAYYALGDGALRQAASTDNALSPYRWYVAITDRNGAQKGVNEVKVKVWGEDATGISPLSVSPEGRKTAVYDLSGRRVDNPTKGLYIVNGKKMMVR